jgi:hypothetical protein
MMTSPELENLAMLGHVKREPGTKLEFEGLVASALALFADAKNPSLALESRFDLAYNAAHALSLAALRHRGYRSGNRYIVFQALPHTLGVDGAIWRVLAQAHQRRNLAEYEGVVDVDETLLTEVLAAVEVVRRAVQKLPSIKTKP